MGGLLQPRLVWASPSLWALGVALDGRGGGGSGVGSAALSPAEKGLAGNIPGGCGMRL